GRALRAPAPCRRCRRAGRSTRRRARRGTGETGRRDRGRSSRGRRVAVGRRTRGRCEPSVGGAACREGRRLGAFATQGTSPVPWWRAAGERRAAPHHCVVVGLVGVV